MWRKRVAVGEAVEGEGGLGGGLGFVEGEEGGGGFVVLVGRRGRRGGEGSCGRSRMWIVAVGGEVEGVMLEMVGGAVRMAVMVSGVVRGEGGEVGLEAAGAAGPGGGGGRGGVGGCEGGMGCGSDKTTGVWFLSAVGGSCGRDFWGCGGARCASWGKARCFWDWGGGWKICGSNGLWYFLGQGEQVQLFFRDTFGERRGRVVARRFLGWAGGEGAQMGRFLVVFVSDG